MSAGRGNAPGSRRGLIMPPQAPVELPEHLRHGTSTSYCKPYRCRCDPCQEWRRAYDREYDRVRRLLKRGTP